MTLHTRSLVARLLAPIAIILIAALAMQLMNRQVRVRIVAADAVVIEAQAGALAMAEARSVSRALQRDALNLVTERDRVAVLEIGARFDRRHADLARRLRAMPAKADPRLRDYVPTQRRVLAELAQVRALARRDRAAALALFQARVRPAERRASVIADAAIERGLARVAAARSEARAVITDGQRQLLVIGLGLSALALALAIAIILTAVLRPLADIAAALGRLAAGDTEDAVPYTERQDEIGAMARSVEVFRAATLERDRLRAAQTDEQRRAVERAAADAGQRTLEKQRKLLLAELAGAVDTSLSAVNDKLRRSADRLRRSADAVTLQAGVAAEESERTADAAKNAADDLLSVTSASAQLVDTVERLRTQTSDAAGAIGRAAARSQLAGARIATLTAHADQVAGMAETIRTVAHRSRLLALNATIEAARVGEAGKGFAVVAGEINNLALQTAAATHDVEAQASSIRGAAEDAVASLAEIEEAIAAIARDASAVGGAMTEQGAAGREIGRGMRTALTEVERVAQRMQDLRRTATATGAVASTLQADAGALAEDADTVDLALRTLVGDLRAAA